MTQEEKQLLLKDLSARLPYNVCVHITYKTGEPCYGKLTPRDIQWFIDSKIENIKPYLRPMSSMTEEEKEEFHKLKQFSVTVVMPNGVSRIKPTYIVDLEDDGDGLNYLYDWLISHHFDFRGLIEKGLALEAPEGMYKTK